MNHTLVALGEAARNRAVLDLNQIVRAEVPADAPILPLLLALLDAEKPRIKHLAHRLAGVKASTLLSSFFRAGMPSPVRFHDVGFLHIAAHVLAVDGLSITDASMILEQTTAQCFNRRLRTLTGDTPTHWRTLPVIETTRADFITLLRTHATALGDWQNPLRTSERDEALTSQIDAEERLIARRRLQLANAERRLAKLIARRDRLTES